MSHMEKQFALRTCSDCGAKRPANQMKSRSVRAGGATFKSRKSITPMTIVGGALGNKRASGAIQSWLFNTSNRRGSAKTYKQVNICLKCYLKPDFSSLGGGFISTLFLWPYKITWALSVSAIKVVLAILTNPKVYTSLWAVLCNIFGLTALGGKRASELAKEKLALKRLNLLDDKATLGEIFKSPEFSEITNYIMMSQVAAADGSFSRDEKRFINSSLEIGAEAIYLGQKVLADQKLANIFIELIRSKDDVDKAFAKKIVTNLFALARVDGSVDESELQILSEYAGKLGLTAADFNKLKARARSETIETGGSFSTDGMDAKITDALAKL